MEVVNKNSIVLTDPSDCLFLKRHTPAFCGVGIKTGSPAAFLHARLGLKDGSVFLDVVVLSGDNFLYVHMPVGLDRACRCIKFFTQRRSNWKIFTLYSRMLNKFSRKSNLACQLQYKKYLPFFCWQPPPNKTACLPKRAVFYCLLPVVVCHAARADPSKKCRQAMHTYIYFK